ncbi:serine/threonine protein kinase [Halopolyspora algeriensis]|uniref:non-specific serine/threonine protein kinase n=1 Tax=Halopolyspora algeriensis TaxID=1500506 RepID=A0A368VX50_9ACTN|nr:serine/threonine-protein kinase [Halopolyspora algeriensis]RCW45887.1 serine/threonine protein kinase [Halopolyspora algeriensis]TQM55301.1 serine/threonine protein kinase [Halopolyspora algeriensis]
MAARTLINDRYELQPLPLAKGGMGEVWEGRDTKLEREVAVKFIRLPEGTTDDELVRRFVRESRITACLQHPGVPAIFDVGTHGERPYLVMQRIRGISVSDLVAEHGALPLGWAAAIAAQACAVLEAAHGASLVHRDLKPANLMLEPDGTVKVLDFGLAVALDMTDESQITRTGQTVGTLAYMAPEQIKLAKSSAQSDLYSLGCVLHEMLTGQQLFTGSTAFEVMKKQVDDRPLPVQQYRSDVPAELDELMAALLDKTAENRPASAHAAYERLLPFAENLGMLPGALHSPSAPSPTRMYASVLSRVFRQPPQPQQPDPDGVADTDSEVPEIPGDSGIRATAETSRTENSAPSGREAPEPGTASTGSAAIRSDISRSEVEKAKTEAASYMQQSHYSRAAELLRSTVDSADHAFGSTDSDVIDLRLEWANVLFEGGEYSRAEPVYRELATDLAERDGPDAELVFRCRLYNATCQALDGNTSQALQTMDSLLADEQRVLGFDDPRTLDLRREIGRLQLGAGRNEDAETTLTALLDDLLRIHGTEDHPTVAKVRELLNDLPGHKR